ncbi:unnamed protein product [Polarella glacialis]|uniref:TLC domain-containing protein n=1 Tax=Polarella glacialis TaxID=89957 RepID=A0A813KCQ5_POLGL|nr:unnamed protein product [Polarella glacialis]
MCEGTLLVQLFLLVCSATLWFFLLAWFGGKIVRPFITKQPWGDQWIEINQKNAKELGVDFDKETTLVAACNLVAVLLQHSLGGALCVPALLGWFSPEVRTALACHGALCEAGWELQDGLERAYHVLFGTEEKKKENPTMVPNVIMGVHHAMGLTMVVPMNIFFPSLYWYHEGIFLLQFAAFFALLIQFYSFTLDVGTQSGLLKMQLSVVAVFSLMIYSRALRYGFVVYKVVAFLYAEGGTVMFVGSCVTALLMSLLNALLVCDSAGKLVKFLPMSVKKEL